MPPFGWTGQITPASVPFDLCGTQGPKGDDLKTLLLQLDPDDDEAEQRIREELERRGARELAQALHGQLDELLPANAGDDAVRQAPDRVAQTGGRVRDVLRRMLQQSADLGVSSAVAGLEGIGIGFDWTLANQDAAEWVRQYTFDLVQGIQQTTQARMQQAVTEWVNNGDPLPALIRELEPLFGRERAKLVAITEVTRAYQKGSELAWRRSGVVEEMEWVTVRDEAVCPRCGPLHGKRTRLERPDFDGLAGPPAHPRCRCFTRPLVKEVQEPARLRNAEAPGEVRPLVVTGQDARETDPSAQITRLTDRKEVLSLGEYRGGSADTVRRHWPEAVTNQVVLTGERRAHYLARHPEMSLYERELLSVLFEPDEIHRNAQDPHIGIWYRKTRNGRYLRAVVWVSDREGLQNSVHSLRLADEREVQQGRRRGRVLWEK